MSNDVSQKQMTYREEGTPFTLELARTLFISLDDGEPSVVEAFTVMDLHRGVMSMCVLGSTDPEMVTDANECLYALEFEDHDEPHLGTLSVPDVSVISDDALSALPVPDGMRVLRRPLGAPVHPVHAAALDVLLRTEDGSGVLTENEFGERLDAVFDEVRYYSLYEHEFSFVGGSGYVPEAVYRQPRTGAIDDPQHHGHAFDPYCCGVARLRALQTTPPLTSARRRGQAGRTDASNGA